MRRFSLLFFLAIGLACTLAAQSDLDVDPKDLKPGGGTYSIGNNCFRLTPARDWSSGTVWYDKAIDLRQPFDMDMDMVFGCKDRDGADGMVFIFLPRQVSTGYQGEGMGFGGLRPSLGIEIDTWYNDHLGDPYEDHVALLVNGSVRHYNNLKGPIKIPNVEDCESHRFRITWEPEVTLLRIELDGVEIMRHEVDMVADIFRGNNKIYWGISAATGNYNNRQEICFEQLTFNTPELGYSQRRRLLQGDDVELADMVFLRGAAKLTPTHQRELQKLKRFLDEHPKHKLQLTSHSFEAGTSERDQRDSELRLEAISAYLQELGIDSERIKLSAMGRREATNALQTGRPAMRGNRLIVRLYKPIP